MRVGLIVYGSLGTLSGGYLYDRQLVAALRDAGDQVAIVSLPWRNYAAHLGDNLATGFARRLAALDVQVLLQDELNHPSLVAVNRALHRRSQVPIVSIVHHLRGQEAHPLPLRTLYRAVEQRYLTGVDGYIFNSRTTRDAVHALGNGAKPGVVVFPGADHLNPPDRAGVQRLIEGRLAAAGPLRLVAVGNVIARKGIHDVVAALALLPPGSCTLQVLGRLDVDPGYVARLRREIVRHGLTDQVTLVGRVSEAVLKAELADAHLLALPSFEGFGIVYLEAMAYGLPVIASTAGAAHEIVTDTQDGFLVAPGDIAALGAILARLAADRAAALRPLAYAARLRYETHPTWRQSMATALDWLHETPERGGRP